MRFIFPLLFVTSFVCAAESPSGMSAGMQGGDSTMTVQVEDWSRLMAPKEDAALLKKQVEASKSGVELQFKRLEGGVGSYYEYYSALGHLLCLQFALDRVEDSQAKLTRKQFLLAEDIKDNFQRRVRFLSNARSVGEADAADLIKLQLNALLFERDVLLLASPAPDAVAAVQVKVVAQAQALLDLRRKQAGVATREQVDAAAALLAREKEILSGLERSK